VEKVLAIYGTGNRGASTVKGKAQLVAELRFSIVDATAFCAKPSVMLAEIE
jgi:type I restriction enzyme R subunit